MSHNVKDMKHPRQPIGWDGKVIRFKENQIVRWMLEMGQVGQKFDLNDIAMKHHEGEFSVEDMVQLDQLVGWSVSGFGDLPYVPKEEVAACDQIAHKLEKTY